MLTRKFWLSALLGAALLPAAIGARAQYGRAGYNATPVFPFGNPVVVYPPWYVGPVNPGQVPAIPPAYYPPTPVNAEAYVPPVVNMLPRTPDTIDAEIDRDGKLVINWQGDPALVQGISIQLLDKDRKELSQTAITKLPAEAKLTITNKTAYYRVTVTYLNGMRTMVTSPL